ncbi:MAG: hypothetical protein ACE5R6_09685 [Candidatus Heimdallarchaeota archaeon]
MAGLPAAMVQVADDGAGTGNGLRPWLAHLENGGAVTPPGYPQPTCAAGIRSIRRTRWWVCRILRAGFP